MSTAPNVRAQNHRRAFRYSPGVAACVAVWLAVTAAGLAALASYSATAAPEGRAPERWPSECGVERLSGRATVLLFLHPHCPCSRATIAMLHRCIARSGGEPDVVALVYAPTSMEASWADGPLRELAAKLPGVRVVNDPDGREARRFGAAASGHIVAYDAAGSLAFEGGITASRGHEGDNFGADVLTAVLRDQPIAPARAPTYGCEIDPAAAAEACPLCTKEPTP